MYTRRRKVFWESGRSTAITVTPLRESHAQNKRMIYTYTKCVYNKDKWRDFHSRWRVVESLHLCLLLLTAPLFHHSRYLVIQSSDELVDPGHDPSWHSHKHKTKHSARQLSDTPDFADADSQKSKVSLLVRRTIISIEALSRSTITKARLLNC